MQWTLVGSNHIISCTLHCDMRLIDTSVPLPRRDSCGFPDTIQLWHFDRTTASPLCLSTAYLTGPQGYLSTADL